MTWEKLEDTPNTLNEIRSVVNPETRFRGKAVKGWTYIEEPLVNKIVKRSYMFVHS